MDKKVPGAWEARLEGKNWQVFDDKGQLIATLAEGPAAEARARVLAMSPYMLQALNGVAALIGDQDLPDNGEFSGAAVSDMVRVSVELVRST